MKTMSIIALASALALPAAAQDMPSPGLEMAKLAYASIPGADTNAVTVEDVLAYGSDVRVSMDHDDDGAISVDEFLGWGFGLRNLAEDKDRGTAFETALRVVHYGWDLNGDGSLSAAEHSLAMSQDFLRSDRDGDAVLTEDEFLSGFLVLHAMDIAIRVSAASEAH